MISEWNCTFNLLSRQPGKTLITSCDGCNYKTDALEVEINHADSVAEAKNRVR